MLIILGVLSFFVLILFSMVNRRAKIMALVMMITLILFTIIQYFDFFGGQKNSSQLSAGVTFIIVWIGMIVSVVVILLRKSNIKKLINSDKIVNGRISHIKETDYSESKYRPKYRIVFKYLDGDGKQKECHTYKLYTLEEVNKIKGLGDIIPITVAGKICKINEDISDEKLNNLKNIPIHKKGRNTGFLVDYVIIIINLIIIIVFSIGAFNALSSYLPAGIPISICFLCGILYAVRNLYEHCRTKKAYKEGLETFAVNFECDYTGRYRWYYIIYYYKTDEGKTKRKKQLVARYIYQNARYMDKLPIKVLGNDASVDIEKIENFTEQI